MNCLECDKSLRNKRSDAKFCSHNCKVKFNNRKKQLGIVSPKQQQSKIDSGNNFTELDKKITAIQQENNQTKQLLNKALISKNKIPVQIEQFEQQIIELNEEINELLEQLALDNDTLYKLHFDKPQPTKVKQYHWAVNSVMNLAIGSYESGLRVKKVEQFKEEIVVEIEELEQEKKECKAVIHQLKQEIKQFNPITDKYLKLIKLNNDRILSLEKMKLKTASPQPKPVVIPKPISKQKSINEIGGADLLNMTFDTFRLHGELGRFLGELDRNMTAFALTGDSGAGKSYFSFELAKAFIDYGFSCKYFSMEEGLGKLTQDKLKTYELGNNITLCGNASLSDVRKDAKVFDLIILDSFQKLNAKSEEFEKLRQDFPKTLFIIIFQKTTAGTMRGGSSIKFNSSATIDVQLQDGERIAVMEKGRYGTIGWVYSISQNIIMKN